MSPIKETLLLLQSASLHLPPQTLFPALLFYNSFSIFLLWFCHVYLHICVCTFSVPYPQLTQESVNLMRGKDFVLFTDMSRVPRTIADTQ